MPRLVISYRREDTAPYAGRLYDRLVRTFGRSSVFMDIDAIAPGEDFVDTIESALSRAQVVLALIGPRWAGIADTKGERRLDDPMDYVRVEIGTALARGMRVIPVLVGGAAVPRAEDLPDDLAALARRQAYPVSDGRFHADVDVLTRFLTSIDEPAPAEAAAGSGDAPAVPPQRMDVDSRDDAYERRYQQLVRSPWLEGNLLWSLGMLSVGLYYFFVASLVVRELRQTLALARNLGDHSAPHDRRGVAPSAGTLAPGVIAHGTGWLLGLVLIYGVLVKPPWYALWIDELLACVAAAFWAGSAWLVSWLWASSRELCAARQQPPGSYSLEDEVARWQAGHLQKLVAFLLMFAFEIYLLMMLERAVAEGMARAIELEHLFQYLTAMIAIPVTLLQAAHCLFKDMLWKLLRAVASGVPAPDGEQRKLARVLRASWFWPWMYANAVMGAYAFFLVHETAISLLVGP